MPWRLKTAAVRLGVACAILLVTNVWSAASSPITVEFGGFVTQFNTDPDDPFGLTGGAPGEMPMETPIRDRVGRGYR